MTPRFLPDGSVQRPHGQTIGKPLANHRGNRAAGADRTSKQIDRQIDRQTDRRARRRGGERGLSEGRPVSRDYADGVPPACGVIGGLAGTAVPDIARRSEEVRERIIAWMMSGLASARGLGALADVGELYVRAVVA